MSGLNVVGSPDTAPVSANGEPAATTYYKIVVTGDVIAEVKLAMSQVRQTEQHLTVFDTASYMKPYSQAIGAASTSEIIRRMLAGLPSISPKGECPVLLSLDRDSWDKFPKDERYWGSYVVCERVPEKPDSSGDLVWRIKQKIGFDRKAPRATLKNLCPNDTGDADLVIVNQSVGSEQAKFGFMGHVDEVGVWPPSLRNPKSTAWLLIEWSRPHVEAPFDETWLKLVDRFENRIIVVVTAEDLRMAGVRISRGISWERTLTDMSETVRKLWVGPPAEVRGPLYGCAHLVVSFGTSGAAIFSAPGGKVSARLVYDPRFLEDGWLDQFSGSSMSGYTRSLTAGVAMEMICAGRGFKELGWKGAKAGVIAARRVLETGFVGIGRLEHIETELPNKLRFPSSVVARVLRSAVAVDGIVGLVEKVATDVQAALLKREDFSACEDLVDQVHAIIHGEKDLDFDERALTEEVKRICGDWAKYDDKAVARADKRALAELEAIAPETWSDEQKKQISEIKERRQKRNKRLIDRILGFIAPDRQAITDVKALQEILIDETTLPPDWSILEKKYPEVIDEGDAAGRILEQCRKIVEYGDSNDLEFPIMRVGKLLVTSRGEMESVTAVRELMESYVGGKVPAPLSIAVFGPPGSGKSFAIKELAANIPSGQYSGITALTFNLSQFSGPEALAVALQQVRDEGLKGRMPLVFWDEFDTEYAGGMGWLRYFLAPMQDGVYQDGSAVYYIGRAIFVFAGGTHDSMADFIGKAKVREAIDPHVATTRNGKVQDADFNPKAKAAKVPDFISRLKGFVDVASLDYQVTKADGRERIVICAPTALRRAKVLRGVLERSDAKLDEAIPHEEGAFGVTLRNQLNVDPGILGAFLRVKGFRYGARSMEAIVNMSALTRKNRYDRSSLPPDDQLNLHVDAKEFIALVNERWPCPKANGAASPSNTAPRPDGVATAGV